MVSIKNKKYLSLILGFLFLLVASVIVYRVVFIYNTSLNILIQNNSNLSLKELSVYCNSTKLNTTHILQSGKCVDLKLNLPTDFVEGNLLLSYEENGLQKDFILCGYIEHGCYKKIKIVYTTDNEFQIE